MRSLEEQLAAHELDTGNELEQPSEWGIEEDCYGRTEFEAGIDDMWLDQICAATPCSM